MNIDIINMGDDLASLALRESLEVWGCAVTLHHIASARQLVRVLNGETAISSHIVLMCHGVEQGLALPDLGPEIAAQQPYQTALSPADLREFLRLPDCLVLNSGCAMGNVEFAEAFLDAGCHAYIGADDYIEGDAAHFYALHFFYELCVRHSSIEEAHRKAASHDSQTQMYRLFARA